MGEGPGPTYANPALSLAGQHNPFAQVFVSLEPWGQRVPLPGATLSVLVCPVTVAHRRPGGSEGLPDVASGGHSSL